MSEVDEVRQALLEKLNDFGTEELVEMFHIDMTTVIEEEVERRVSKMSVKELLEKII